MQCSRAFKQLRKPSLTWRRSAEMQRRIRPAGISHHFGRRKTRSYLKANKVSKSEGTMKVEYVYHF